MSDDFSGDFGSGGGDMSVSSSTSLPNLKKIIPIAIIIIIIIFVLFKTNIFSDGLSFLNMGSKGAEVLIIGQPSHELVNIINDSENKDVFKNTPRTEQVDNLTHNPVERIKNYDIIILDQSLSSDKSIPRPLGEAITNFVKKGGKLIIVLNSGTQRPDDPSIMGWKANFGDIVPVSCDRYIRGMPSCSNNARLQVAGRIYAYDEDHPIMSGILRAPALDIDGLYQTTLFDIDILGKEIAYFRDEQQNKTYTAIVEKPMLLGKVIYFNYNPGLSKAIFINTIQYLS